VSELVLPSEEVGDALASGRAVVALETSVIGQGLPPPRNIECAQRMTAAIRASGATPAWTAVVEGEVRVGLTDRQLEAFADPGRSSKVARRDIAFAVANGLLGATTVSATIWAASEAGVRICVTGGIGGVHTRSGDVSADLLELSRTSVLLVCSGPKSIVDPIATAERLDELGIATVGYRTDLLPFFVVAATDVELDQRVDDAAAAARLVRAQESLRSTAAILLCNPVSAAFALDAAEVANAVRVCEDDAKRYGIRGKAVTPFLLSCVAARTDGSSLEANLALLESNARLAGEVAVAAAVA
jgi:pseudouridine-5'-phosphate glycosidase